MIFQEMETIGATIHASSMKLPNTTIISCRKENLGALVLLEH